MNGSDQFFLIQGKHPGKITGVIYLVNGEKFTLALKLQTDWKFIVLNREYDGRGLKFRRDHREMKDSP